MNHLRQALRTQGTATPRLKEGAVYLLIDEQGIRTQFRVLGADGDEVVMTPKLSTKKSALIAAAKKLRLFQKLLLAAGLFGGLKS